MARSDYIVGIAGLVRYGTGCAGTAGDIKTRADEAASRRDADGYVELFTDDAVLDGTQGRHAGRAAMRASVGPIWAAQGPATLHLTLSPVIEPGPSDRSWRISRRTVAPAGSYYREGPPVLQPVLALEDEVEQ